MTSSTHELRLSLKNYWTTFFSSSLIGYLSILAAAAAWGSSGIFIKLVVNSSGVSATALAFWRDLTTFTILVTGGLLFAPAKLAVKRSDLIWLAGMGGSLGIFHIFWNLGVILNGVSVTTVQQAAMPVIVTVVAWLVWQEDLTWRKIMAILLTFIGTALVSGLTQLGQADLTLSSLLVGFCVPVTYAGLSLFGKKIRTGYEVLVVLTYAFGVAALVLFPFQFFTPQPFPVPAITYVWFAGFILIATLAGFACYAFGLGRLPASIASILVMSEIAFAVVYAYILVGERLTPVQILGSVLVIGGVLLLFRRKAPSPKPPAPSPETIEHG